MPDDVAKLVAEVASLHRRLDRIDVNIDRSQTILSERDNELHTIIKDMELTRERQAAAIAACQNGLQKLLEKQTEMEDDIESGQSQADAKFLTLTTKLENMSLIFGAARWVLNIAIPVLVSAAVMLLFKLPESPL